MKRNLSETEQRLLALLKVDSRKNISEIASTLGISRVTAKKTLDGLIENAVIKSFTITLDDEENDMVLVHVEHIREVPEDLVLEDYHLIDGTHLLVLYYENLPKLKDAKILDVRIAVKRVSKNGPGRVEHIHCDLCGKEILSQPISVTVNRKVYYACCPTCEKGLKRRLASASAK